MNMDTMEATHKLYRYLDVYATPDAASANSHHRGGLEITLVLEGPSLMRLRSLSAPQRRWLQRCACNMFLGTLFTSSSVRPGIYEVCHTASGAAGHRVRASVCLLRTGFGLATVSFEGGREDPYCSLTAIPDTPGTHGL